MVFKKIDLLWEQITLVEQIWVVFTFYTEEKVRKNLFSISLYHQNTDIIL